MLGKAAAVIRTNGLRSFGIAVIAVGAISLVYGVLMLVGGQFRHSTIGLAMGILNITVGALLMRRSSQQVPRRAVPTPRGLSVALAFVGAGLAFTVLALLLGLARGSPWLAILNSAAALLAYGLAIRTR